MLENRSQTRQGLCRDASSVAQTDIKPSQGIDSARERFLPILSRMKFRSAFPLLVSGFLAASLNPVALADSAESSDKEKPKRNVDGIMDNSFLVEEAYNQEAGVVQHIFNSFYAVNQLHSADERGFALSFTQEWPIVSQTHQFSYTVPFTDSLSGGSWHAGFGDVLLNYRYQAYFNEENLRAFAPRASLLIPTGDDRRGFGEGSAGAQFNLPFSTAIGDYFFLHSNAGLTWVPRATSLHHEGALGYNLGQSVIYAVTPDFNLMLEWVGYWTDQLDGQDRVHTEFASLISPGFRKAFNFSNGSQLVLGLAAPIGLNRTAPDYGVFLYASFEHFFKRPEQKK